MSCLIDRVMPAWEFREHHRRVLPATAESAFTALARVDLARSPLIGPLFALRSLPARLTRGDAALAAGRLGDFLSNGFVPLLEEPPRGYVFGSIGEFWRPAGAMRRFEAASFAANREAGCARLALSFEFLPRAAGCVATTETRIACNDAAAYRRMLAYWILIRPASGLIRREMLRLLERACRESADRS